MGNHSPHKVATAHGMTAVRESRSTAMAVADVMVVSGARVVVDAKAVLSAKATARAASKAELKVVIVRAAIVRVASGADPKADAKEASEPSLKTVVQAASEASPTVVIVRVVVTVEAATVVVVETSDVAADLKMHGVADSSATVTSDVTAVNHKAADLRVISLKAISRKTTHPKVNNQSTHTREIR